MPGPLGAGYCYAELNCLVAREGCHQLVGCAWGWGSLIRFGLTVLIYCLLTQNLFEICFPISHPQSRALQGAVLLRLKIIPLGQGLWLSGRHPAWPA